MSKDAHGYVEVLSIVTVHFVQAFCQRGVNNQLATSPVLRRRVSLCSLLFAFHHIRQNLERKHTHKSTSRALSRRAVGELTFSSAAGGKHAPTGDGEHHLRRSPFFSGRLVATRSKIPRVKSNKKQSYLAYLFKSGVLWWGNIVEELLRSSVFLAVIRAGLTSDPSAGDRYGK